MIPVLHATTIPDTGWRDMTDLIGTGGTVLLRRWGPWVRLSLRGATVSGSSSAMWVPAAGFGLGDDHPVSGLIQATGSYAAPAATYVISSQLYCRYSGVVRGQVTWLTDDAWPTVLPGTPH